MCSRTIEKVSVSRIFTRAELMQLFPEHINIYIPLFLAGARDRSHSKTTPHKGEKYGAVNYTGEKAQCKTDRAQTNRRLIRTQLQHLSIYIYFNQNSRMLATAAFLYFSGLRIYFSVRRSGRADCASNSLNNPRKLCD